MDVSSVLKLLGGVALFLFGMSLMGDSLKKVAGNKLEVFLYKLTSNRLKGILLGTAVTAIIQSSSATSAMVVGFVNSGMMKVKQAISIIMGAIIGTSITGWIISLSYIGNGKPGVLDLFSTSSLSAIIGVIGIVLIMGSKKRKIRNTGEILMGFAVLMIGMEQMSLSVSGLRTNPIFLNFFTSFSNPVIGILVGALFTSIIQSASAAVGIIQALSTTGVISLGMSLPIIMGIAIGASIPVIVSSIGANTSAKRSAWSYLVIDIIGVVVFSILFYGLNPLFNLVKIDMIVNPVDLALANTVFRVIIIILQAPFISLIEKITCSLIKEDKSRDEQYAEVNNLEERFLKYPPLACENVSNAMNSMADKVLNILCSSISLFEKYDEKIVTKIEQKEEIIDEYEDKIGVYLTKMAGISLNGEQSRLVGRYLHSVTDLERISDHALNLSEIVEKINEDKKVFTTHGRQELEVLFNAIREVATLTVDSFIASNKESAYKVEPLEQVIDELVDQMKENHVRRLQEGKCSITSGYVFNDLLTNLERISDHCSNIALSTIAMYDKNLDVHDYEIKVTHEQRFKKYYSEFRELYKI